MLAVPVFYASDPERSLAFYTVVLEFRLRYPQWREVSLAAGVIDLEWEGAVLQLSKHMGKHPTPSSVNVEMATPADVDVAWARLCARGLDQSDRADSPVHLAPLDQTWGTREVYVNDPDGNCLCLRAWR